MHLVNIPAKFEFRNFANEMALYFLWIRLVSTVDSDDVLFVNEMHVVMTH